MRMLHVKSPTPARFPAYRIESEAGEVLATVPITASGDSHKLALVMAASPAMLAALQRLVNDSMFKDHPEASQMAIDAITAATGAA